MLKLQSSLRTRLVVVMLAAMLPLLGWSIYNTIRESRGDDQLARSSLEFAASLAAARQDQIAESARYLLTAIGYAPGLAAERDAQCTPYLQKLRGSFPAFHNFGIIDSDGFVRCQALPGAPGQTTYAGDLEHFRNAMAMHQFVVGRYTAEHVSGRATLPFAMPVANNAGDITGIAFASLDLAQLEQGMQGLQLPAGSRLTLLDQEGTVLVSGEATPVGGIATSDVLRQAVTAFKPGYAEGVDGKGVARMYAFAPARAATGVFVSVSMARTQMAGTDHRAWLVNLLALALAVLAGIWAAGLLGRRAIMEPAFKILEATRNLKTGQKDTRIAGLNAGAAYEFTRIAEGFNLIADSLQQRQRDLEAELSRSQHAYTTVELILNSMEEGLIALDTRGQSLLLNNAAAHLFPVDLSDIPAEQWADRLSLFLPSGARCTLEELPLYRALQGESGHGVELTVRNAQAPEGRTLRCSYRPIHTQQGIAGALAIFSDITDLQRLQGAQVFNMHQLQDTQRKLMEALHIGRIGNWEFDVAANRFWWSDEVFALYDYPIGEFIPTHEHVVQRIHPDDMPRYTKMHKDALDSDAMLDIEFRIVLSDGRIRWLHHIGRSHISANGAPKMRSGVVQDVTGRKQADAELVLLHNAVSHINDIVLISEAASKTHPYLSTVFVNGAFERLTGYDATESLGSDPRMLLGPDSDPQAIDRITQALSSRISIREEILLYSKSGNSVWVELDLVPLFDDGGWNTHWIAVLRDMTDRKHADRALVESEQRYLTLFDQGPLPMWVFDEETMRFLAVNTAATNLYGFSHDEFSRLTLTDILPVPERGQLRNKRLPGYSSKPEREVHMSSCGSEFPVETVSHPITYDGHPARFVVAHDISARVKAERELQEHLFMLQRAADATQAVVQHQTLQGTLQEVVEQSRAVIRAHQAAVTLKLGVGWADSVSAISLSDKYAEYREFLDDPDGTGICALVCETNRPMRMTQPELEAHPRWCGFGDYASHHPAMRGWLAVPLIGRGGANIGLLQLTDKYDGDFTAQDEYVAMELAQLASIAIGNAQLLEQVRELNTGLEVKVTERTAQLAREEARYRALAEEAPQVVWNYEPNRGITYFNRAWYDLVGGTPADWRGNRWIRAIHPDDRAPMMQNWMASEAARTPFVGIRRLLAKNGSYRAMSYHGVPVLDQGQNVIAWVGIDADITEIKTIEEALRQSNQELEAFSYSVSHDLRSPLNSIDGFSRLLARQLEGQLSEQGTHYLARIQAGVAHMGQLIEGLLSLAQVSRTSLHRETVDVSLIAHETLERYRQRDPEREAVIQVQDGMNLPGDPRLIRVVLDNLIGNAWKFTAKQAVTEISVGAMPLPQAHATRDIAGALASPWVYFVRDNGAGFDMAYAGKLFGVFQRLHAARDFPGTGIGLATVHRIVTRHHGRVWAESQVGVGTTFYFTVAENAALIHALPGKPGEA